MTTRTDKIVGIFLTFTIHLTLVSPVLAACDEKEHLKIYERIDYIEQYLDIPMGEKEKINRNSTWFDPVKRVTLGHVGYSGSGISKGGRFDKLAEQLGYLWFIESENDWPTWNKVSKECIPENNCLDTNLGSK